MKLKTILLLLCWASVGQAQEIGVKLTNNVTSFPVMGTGVLFQAPMHPGVAVTYVHPWIERGRHEWVPNADLNYVYHRLFQSSVALNVGLDYRIRLGQTWKLQAGLSGGYLHSFYHYDRFELENGSYQKIPSWKGKSQFNVGLDIAVIKKLPVEPGVQLFLEYAPYVHGTFAKSYVPVVPYNSLGIGVLYSLSNTKEEKP